MRLLLRSAIPQVYQKALAKQCKLLLQNIKARGSPMAISDWPQDDRPREKLLAKGPGSLSDAELLAIFLRTGTKGKSAVDLARALLAKFDSLTGLISASRDAFCTIPGLGSAKYAQLQAATELTRRALVAEMKSGVNLSSPTAVRDFLRL